MFNARKTRFCVLRAFDFVIIYLVAAQHEESRLTIKFKASRSETRRSNPTLLNSDVFDDDTGLLQDEFHRLLEKSRFVADVIELYINNDEHRSRAENVSNTDSHRRTQGHTVEWQELVRASLPDWLFWLTYTLTAQAKLAEEDCPMSRAQLAGLLNDRLFRQISNDLLFKAHRKRLWTPALLRNLVHDALKDINTPGRVTLENLAMGITLRSRRVSSPIKLLKPLSGKHLQKLLRQNDIKWIEIKRSYIERLLYSGEH